MECASKVIVQPIKAGASKVMERLATKLDYAEGVESLPVHDQRQHYLNVARYLGIGDGDMGLSNSVKAGAVGLQEPTPDSKPQKEDVSISFKINETQDGVVTEVKTEKTGDRAGFGWTEYNMESIVQHLVQNADGGTVTEGNLPPGLVDDLFGAIPKGKMLPQLHGKYFYVQVKKDHVPWRAKYSNIPKAMLVRLKKILDNMVEMGVIAWRDTPYTCPINLVLKVDSTGDTVIDRLVVDARILNSNLDPDQQPHVPLMDELFLVAEGQNYFTTIDAVKSFWQCGVFPPHQIFCGVQTPFGSAVFLRCMFGIKTAPSQVQRLMEEILGPELYKICMVFIDDTLIYTQRLPGESEAEGMQRHMADVARVVHRLAAAGVTISLQKSRWFRHECEYLGFILGRKGLSITKQKQAKVIDAPFPTTPKDLHTLLGAAGFLSRCLRCNLSSLTKPLRRYVVMGSDRKYKEKYDPTSPEVITAVTALKERIASAVTLRPADYSRPFSIFVDGAQSAGVGYSLMQHYEWEEGEQPWHEDGEFASEQLEFGKATPPPPAGAQPGYYVPIYFASKSLTADHARWDTREVEVFAIICALKKFEPWCLGATKIFIHSDHKNCAYLDRYKSRYAKLARCTTMSSSLYRV
jgi:hypothetical protein